MKIKQEPFVCVGCVGDRPPEGHGRSGLCGWVSPSQTRCLSGLDVYPQTGSLGTI